uniref:Uncharacterized protein n=1 Tax=Arundo donax TaxID=35708 RepID=A0A0A8YVF0_ARUDO
MINYLIKSQTALLNYDNNTVFQVHNLSILRCHYHKKETQVILALHN